MKTRCIIAATVALLAFAQWVGAQTAVTPPGLIDYQGTVLDVNGSPIAPTTPTNYQLIFRIYTAQSGGTPLWGEQQTVTVSNGLFTVQLGGGTSDGIDPNFPISQVFSSNSVNGFAVPTASRYLGVTVVIPPATPQTAAEITPRLAFLTTPFSYSASHAATADSANGVVTATPGSSFSGTIASTAISGGTVTNAAISSGSISGSAVTGGTITGAQISNCTVAGNGSGLTNLNASNFTSGTLASSLLPADVALTDAANTFTKTTTLRGGASMGAASYLNQYGLYLRNDGYHYVQYNSEVNGAGLFGYAGGVLGTTIQNQSNPTFALVWKGANVGIGTENPKYPLDVESSVNAAFSNYGYLNQGGAGHGDSSGSVPFSIYASGRMAASEFDSFSDARIKNVKGRSDGAADLTLLQQIQVTDYTFKDVIGKGDRPYKKAIAQQVEQVYPAAVNKCVNVIPDIYQKAQCKDGWITLSTNLNKGDHVRLIAENRSGLYEVLEAQPDRFLTEFKPEGDSVFVYGREVNDFRTIDYEAIAMLNVSATQEIKREADAEIKSLKERLNAVRDENDELRHKLASVLKQIASLESKDAEREARLAKVEAALMTGKTDLNTPAASPGRAADGVEALPVKYSANR